MKAISFLGRGEYEPVRYCYDWTTATDQFLKTGDAQALPGFGIWEIRVDDTAQFLAPSDTCAAEERRYVKWADDRARD